MPIARRYARIIPPHPKRPSISWLILDKIGEAGMALLDGFFPAKYPEARMWRGILGLDPTYRFKRETFASLLSQLKRQGLVERTNWKGRDGWYWRLTARGRAALRSRERDALPKSDGRKRLVCFDIPERDRAKRRWLRGELIACGYHPLQRSVWIGEAPLPQAFIEGLDLMHLRRRVYIVRVTAEGSWRDR